MTKQEHKLKLSATPGVWRIFAARKSDPAFIKFSKKVLERDNNTCQFCGFQAQQYQEIINIDGNYRNNKIENLITACCFCAQCFFLEAVGKNDYGGGRLIYLEEIEQSELNGLCHVLFCAIANATAYRTDAQTIYRDLKLRAQIIEDKLGTGMSDPSLFSRILIDAQTKQNVNIDRHILSHLRLLPSRSKFSQQIEAWASAAMEELAEANTKE